MTIFNTLIETEKKYFPKRKVIIIGRGRLTGGRGGRLAPRGGLLFLYLLSSLHKHTTFHYILNTIL